MSRARLPERRPNETIDLAFAGRRFAVTVGFYPNGRPGEVFTSGVKVGSDLDAILADACVAVSLLLQHGVEPAALARAMGRAGDGITPASVIGALSDLLSTADAANGLSGPANGPWIAPAGDAAGQVAINSQTASSDSLIDSALEVRS